MLPALELALLARRLLMGCRSLSTAAFLTLEEEEEWLRRRK